MVLPSSPAIRPSSPWLRDVLILVLLVGAVNFFLLGRLPLANPDEPRYAQIPREMLAAGDWTLGRLNDVPYLEKPPLVYWLVGWCHRVFGPGEASMRLTPVLFGLAGVLLTYAAARRLYDQATGFTAALVLGTSLLYFAMSRLLLLDMTLSVLMAATLFCFILGVREPAGLRRRWLFYGLYASAALATLTKGLIGFLIPGAVMFLWLLLFNQWKRLRPLHLPDGMVLFLAIAGPWHVLAAQRHPGWAEFYFVNEHWRRFTEPGHGRSEPWWFFGPILVLGLFPWVGFLGGAVREALAGGWRRRNENADAWFLVVWAAFVFVFFNASRSKLIPYILPMFPALAVLIGARIARCHRDKAAARLRFGFSGFAFLSGILAVAVLVVVLKAGAIRDAAQAASLRPYGVGMAVVLLVGGVLAPWAARMRGIKAGLATLVAATAGFFALVVLAAPHFQRADTKSLALLLRERGRPDDRVYHFWAFFHDFVYYAQRPADLVSYTDEMEVQFLEPAERAARFINDAELKRQWAGSKRVWVVLRKRDIEHFRAHVVTSYQLIGEGRGHYLFSNQP